ncbi:hypothetical protein AC579_5787 [Pseudocercospora musae]|uniref:Uncharacterized protein n=1 Tax=Pseudocercospora musae TaxID=113226 RepID=A0A139IRP3_9PEZI|nr:hypothetical protein AC579_5787 [Pseudocercospora musae]
MSDSKQLEADSASSRPNLWSESVVPRDNAESRTPEIPNETAQQVAGCKLFEAPAEIRNEMFERALDEEAPEVVVTPKVDQNRLTGLALFDVSSQVSREKFSHERRDVQDVQDNHRSEMEFTLEEIRMRCMSPRHLLHSSLDREVSSLSIPLVKELEIYITMPSPHCRAGKQILFRITWMEDDAYVNFEVLGWRLDPKGNGKNGPADVPHTLEHLENCANAFARRSKLTRHARSETYLSVKVCVGFVYELFGRDCCFQELLRLSESTNGGMAARRAQSQRQTACMLLPSSDGPSTEKQIHLPREHTEEAYHAMATHSTGSSTPKGKAAESKVTKGRRPLNPRTQDEGR